VLKPLEYLYFLVAAIEMVSELTGNETLKFFSKPLLMIVLVAFYAQAVKGAWNKMHTLIATAFVFSWIGDVALMFVGDGELMGIPRNPNYFLAGLVGFLVTHVLYAIAFADVTNKKATALLPKRFWVMVPLLIYMVALLSMLVPNIIATELTKPFLVPVLVYSTAIATMVVFAINRYKRVSDKSFALVFAGALLFMFSDSLIAINKFMHPFATSGIFIMFLYTAGQYLIAKGCIEQFRAAR
jgi:uncharacterized membrane protein YhhN